MDKPWSLVVEQALFNRLMAHLFPGDGDEHGAVIAAGVATSIRGTRLLARDLFLAQDGIDFVPDVRGYRRLTAEFVRDKVTYCTDQRLSYLAIHNHGGRDFVEFSEPDNASHERGYPALLDISSRPVGALVFAQNAMAGDIWTPDRRRRPLQEMVVVGPNITRLYSEPPSLPPAADAMYDRQVRWLGDRGQHQLSRLKVAVIGAGGVGLPVVTMLARLGVGTLVVIDPDRVEPTNLPRLDVSRWSAMLPLRRWRVLEPLANRLSRKKVQLAAHAARRANPQIEFIGIDMNVVEPSAALSIVDADFIFLAADSHQARMVFNAIVHQYLIPGIQIGTRIETEAETGIVTDIRSNIRLVLPHTGCLRCNRLISGTKLQRESISEPERRRNRYADELPAASVITFNTQSAGQAASDFLLMFGGLIENVAATDYLRVQPRLRVMEPVVPLPNSPQCSDCGAYMTSRRARGDSADLPLPERSRERRRR
jgi:molybdopterin/thiamine biosynthesis adenylyltransferase